MVKYASLIVFFILFVFQVAGQTAGEIRINVRNSSLSEILHNLKDQYGLQFSFDHDVLSRYALSLDKTFSSDIRAIEYLLSELPLQYEQIGEVFVIVPLETDMFAGVSEISTNISGQVLEASSHEPLPYSYITVNNKNIQSDHLGNFNFNATSDSVFDLRISHLGYYVFDTTLTSNYHNTVFLDPQPEEIDEVKVVGSIVEKSTLIGDRAGHIKINHQIAPVLPGYGDNSVFNLLRLMPGIMAAGEHSNDLLIWGAYESHSKINFDGFTLFGLKNFNDDISLVNPLVVKNIEVMKGGYAARYGGRVGAFVEIEGKNGTLKKPSFTFSINSATINSMMELPLGERTSLLAAYRQTYYQLYDPYNVDLFRRKNRNPNGNPNGPGSNTTEEFVNFDIEPDFIFRDANLKLSHRGEKGGQFDVSLYGGGDRFDYEMEGSLGNNILRRMEEEKNRQLGSSFRYNQLWKNKDRTRFNLSYSVYEKDAFEQNKTRNIKHGRERITKQLDSENNVDELSFEAEHMLHFKNGHQMRLGSGVVSNSVQLSRIAGTQEQIGLDDRTTRLFAYAQDEFMLSDWLELKSGLRLVYSEQTGNWYPEPRVSASASLSENIKLNAAWGLYNQFIAKTSIVDSSYNYSYFWTLSDDQNIPVLSAQHWVGGLSYHKKGTTLSAEAFYKTTDGISRFFNGSKHFSQGFYVGDAKARGIDLFARQDIRNHTLWMSYTLSKTEEQYPFYIRDKYKPAPHHQLHELKLVGIVNLGRFYLSGSYVYGSGFERFDFETEEGLHQSQPYHRMDASVVYRFRPGKVKTEAGLSVLNVFDYDNVKYANLRRTSSDDINLLGIYSEAVPFTPTVFFKIKF